MATKGAFNELARAVGEAIDDIRHKVVEEAWFGRAVTDGQPQDASPHDPTQPSIGGSVRVVYAAPQQMDAWDEAVHRVRAQQEEPGRDLPFDREVDR